jgi:hypothetical protein
MGLKVNDIEIYEIAQFETDTPHCPVEDFLITANSPPNTIFYPALTCSGPETCYKADINTLEEATITFFITIVAGKGKVFISTEQVTIKVECGLNIKIKSIDPPKGFV